MQLLLEGWRGINQSLAIVNQFQALALLRRQDVTLFHRDLPTPMDWNGARNTPGFAPKEAGQIAAIRTYSGEPIDAVYRIVAPSRSGASDGVRRTVTFMVTELGLGPSSFAPETDLGFFTRDENLIVTPTAWSAERLVEAGFDADRVRIIPHGVERSLFHPLAPTERASVRARFGFAQDETVLLNIGGPFWNKGADLLLEAFALLRARGRRVRLVLKDQSSLYGLSMQSFIAQVGARRPELVAEDTLAAITLFPGALDFAQLRELFALADAYVSPYRGEGFNLPVLEAIACGVPVIVTSGGATDDFCPEPLATRLPSVGGALAAEQGFPPPRFMEPKIDDLVEAMDRVCQVDSARPAGWDLAREAVLRDFSWDRAAALILDCAQFKVAANTPPSVKSWAPPAKQVSNAPKETGPGLKRALAARHAEFIEAALQSIEDAETWSRRSAERIDRLALQFDEFIKKESARESRLEDALKYAEIAGTPILTSGCADTIVRLPNLSEGPAFNPSAIRQDDGFIFCSRQTNLCNRMDGTYFYEPGAIHNSTSVLQWTDSSLSVTRTEILDDSLVRDRCRFAANGIEDIRLFRWKDSIFGLGAAVASDDNLHFAARQILMRIEGRAVIDYQELQSPIGAPIEKNWTPIVVDDNLFIVYSLSPYVVYQYADSELKLVRGVAPSANNCEIRGGTQFVRMDDKYIGLGHFRPIWYKSKFYYRHAFIVLDNAINIEDISEPFFIQRRGIEFASGLELHLNGLLLSYGVSDRAAACVAVTRSELLKWVVL